MKFFSWLTNTNKRSLENPAVPLSQAYDYLVDNPSSSGVSVNRKSVLGNPAVFRAVNLISQSVAKIPLVIYRNAENDSREKATGHPAFRLLMKQPSELYHAFTFKMTLQSHALLFGNGYAYVRRDETGKPVELMILDPEDTYADMLNGRLIYKTLMDNTEFRIPFSDCIHIKGLSHDALSGYSLMDVMKDALGLGISLQKYGSTFFKNNAKPSVVIELPPNIRDAEKIERFRNTWGNLHQGVSNAHRPALLMSGAKLTTLGGDNESSQFLQSREHDIVMVSDILGVPASMLGSQVNVSYGSLEMDMQNFLSTGLDPWLCQWERECEVKLLSERQKERDTHFIEAQRKALLQIDGEKEVNLIISQLNNGLLSWEESRKLMNLATDKDEAEEWRRPSNITLEGEAAEPPAAPETPPEPEEDDQPQEETEEVPEDILEEESSAQRGLKAMTKLAVERLIKRCAKAADSGKLDMMNHHDIWSDSLSPFQAEEWSENTLKRLEEELQAVLPEQRSEVFSRLDLDKMTEELMEQSQ